VLNDIVVPLEFDALPLNDLFFNCVLDGKAVDHDRVLLPDAMSSVHSLEVDLWVEVGVVDDDYRVL
jgi:hypothetical protein